MENIITENGKEFLEITPEPIQMRPERYSKEDILADIASLEAQLELKRNLLALFK